MTAMKTLNKGNITVTVKSSRSVKPSEPRQYGKFSSTKPRKRNIRGVATDVRQLFSQFVDSEQTTKVVHLLEELLLEYKTLDETVRKQTKLAKLEQEFLFSFNK